MLLRACLHLCFMLPLLCRENKSSPYVMICALNLLEYRTCGPSPKYLQIFSLIRSPTSLPTPKEVIFKSPAKDAVTEGFLLITISFVGSTKVDQQTRSWPLFTPLRTSVDTQNLGRGQDKFFNTGIQPSLSSLVIKE